MTKYGDMGEPPAKQGITRDKLLAMVPSYRAGYVSAGGRDEDIRDDQAIVTKLEEENVWNEAHAEQCGRADGFKAREDAQARGKW
jgi:hypothetical protein